MGAIRLMLALGVLLAHMNEQILEPEVHADADFRLVFGLFGGYSVLWFYVISGFLMSMVLSQKYSADFPGTMQFFRSRILRIYPLWICAFLFSAAVVDDSWSSQHGFLSYVSGLGLLGIDWRLVFSTFPELNWPIFPKGADVGWTLGAELTFYLLAPFVLRSLKWSIALFCLSLLLRISIWRYVDQTSDVYLMWNYFFFPSTLCFFLLGHLSRVFWHKMPLPPWLAAVFLILSLALSTYMIGMSFDNAYMYVSVALFAFSLPGVFSATKDNAFFNFLGDLTYPLYLIGNICLQALFAEWSGPVINYGIWMIDVARLVESPYMRALFVTAAVAGFTLLAAIAVRYLVERPLIALMRYGLDTMVRILSRILRFGMTG